jgi:hypothetical protein
LSQAESDIYRKLQHHLEKLWAKEENLEERIKE